MRARSLTILSFVLMPFLALISAQVRAEGQLISVYNFIVSSTPPLSIQKSEELLDHISREEEALGVQSIHQSNWMLHYNEDGQIQYTDSVAVIYHGLSSSPMNTAKLAGLLHDLGLNVLSVRIIGHQESDPKRLNRTHHSAWVEQAKAMASLAQSFGKRTVFVGHSAGGLLATYSASLTSDQSKALVAIGPALSLKKQGFIRTLHWADFEGRFKGDGNSQRYYSTSAAIQVMDASKRFLQSLSGGSSSLWHVPSLVFDLDNDHIIDSEFNSHFFQQFDEIRYVQLPKNAQLDHASMIEMDASVNPSFETMSREITDFLKELD